MLSEKSVDNEKIIILGTIPILKQMAQSKLWLMDGTFYVVPCVMKQLFSIHFQTNNEILPGVFCLMSRKSSKLYELFFSELCNIAAANNVILEPKYIISDFEKASIKASSAKFPKAINKGCLFHLGQIIYRKIQKERLAVKYGQDESFSLNMRMLKSLAFVPSNEIPFYYKELCKQFGDSSSEKIGKWFKRNYIGSETKNIKALYLPQFWSCGDLIKENFPRTQNNVEAWHARIKILANKPHIGLYKLIQLLANETLQVNSILDEIESGGRKKRIKKAYLKKERNIKKIIDEKEERSHLGFLKGLALNMML